ncbi:MAG TPA: glycosyltransferase family 2 protein [Thermoanaerobaculia bacterium]
MRTSVIIPVFNERDSLSLVVGDIPRGLVSEIVVVDNGSTDGTDLVAQRLTESGGACGPANRLEISGGPCGPLHVRLVRESRRGYGSACLAGLAALEASPPDVVVFLDGDYSDHPEEMTELLSAIDRGADLAIGSRTLGQRERGALLPQARLGNLLACVLIGLLYGYRYTDLGPFRAIRWDACRRLRMRDPDFGWTCEMQVKALREGLSVTEIPVSYRRRVGVSKITGTLSGTLRAGFKILWTIVRFGIVKRKT